MRTPMHGCQGENQRTHCIFTVNVTNLHAMVLNAWSENTLDYIVPHVLFQVLLNIPVIGTLSDSRALLLLQKN